MLADLHVHTKASDGLFSAEEVCQMALKAGLSAIAITDHDTLEGVKSLERPVPGLQVMTGVEISTEWRGGDVHILGYNFNENHGLLQETLREFQEERKRRITKMVNKLVSLGYDISEEEVAINAKGDSIGRPHVAQALVAKGYFKDVNSAFEQLLERGGPAYVPREKTSPQKGIEAILSSGGVPVLAHPGLIENFSDLIGELVPLGLKGVEVYYPLHSDNFVAWMLKTTKNYGLLATGGSDFHGFRGDFLGESTVDVSVLEKIRAASGLAL